MATVDKVKPLKIESPALGGSQTDPFPQETDPSEDYLAAKGVAFENLDSTRVFSEDGVMKFEDSENPEICTLSDLCRTDFDKTLFNSSCDPLFIKKDDGTVEVLEIC